MKNINRYIMAIGTSSLLLVTGCKKDFLNINDNPNFPNNVQAREVLPYAELTIGHIVGNNLQVYGSFWAQYWTQNPYSSQYKTIEQYSPAADDFNNVWAMFYSDALKDLKVVIDKANSEGKTQYVACAKLLQAYTFQLLTDNFGDVPFSEALKAEDGTLFPKYDSQKNVYAGIINLINEAVALIDVNSSVHPGTDDVIFGGDMSMWGKFANTLKLKVYLRLAYVDPATAQSGISALAGKPFLEKGETAMIKYTETPGNTHPYFSVFADIQNTQNIVASSTCVDTMDSWSDPRLALFYAPLSNGTFSGIEQGDYTSGTPVTSISFPSPNTGANAGNPTSAKAPVRLISDYESLFLQAEAAARGWLAGNAKTFYEDGIKASFVSYQKPDGSVIPAADATKYIAQPQVSFPSNLTKQIEFIITQKWIAMCGTQGDEAWIEQRRTGYPNFFSVSVNSILGGNKMPNRLFYPSNELNRNPNVPAQPTIDAKVWWDVN